MGFNEDMERLQEIMNRFETDEIDVEESMVLFEEGVTLIKRCRAYLGEFKRKITILSDDRELPWDVVESSDKSDKEKEQGDV